MSRYSTWSNDDTDREKNAELVADELDDMAHEFCSRHGYTEQNIKNCQKSYKSFTKISPRIELGPKGGVRVQKGKNGRVVYEKFDNIMADSKPSAIISFLLAAYPEELDAVYVGNEEIAVKTADGAVWVIPDGLHIEDIIERYHSNERPPNYTNKWWLQQGATTTKPYVKPQPTPIFFEQLVQSQPSATKAAAVAVAAAAEKDALIAKQLADAATARADASLGEAQRAVDAARVARVARPAYRKMKAPASAAPTTSAMARLKASLKSMRR